MTLSRKRRTINTFKNRRDIRVTRNINTGAVVAVENISYPPGLSGCQITDSEGHAWDLRPRPEGDLGGPFKTRKIYIKNASHLGFGSKYNGPFPVGYHNSNAFALPSTFLPITTANGLEISVNYPDLSSSQSTMDALGAIAISRCAPVNSTFDAATSLGELVKDGLPTILGLKALKERRLHSIGDEFLNFQFALMPLWNDIKSLGTAIKDRDRILKQLRRDSGKQVRRRYEFPTEKEVITDTSLPSSLQTSIATHGLDGFTGICRKQVTVERRQWFSGAFTYYLPDSSELGGFSRMALEADRLYGAVPDVADLWNLMPWSWAVDWFVNVGPVLTNVANFSKYGLVMPYAYMMEHTIVKYEFTFTGGSVKSLPGPVSITVHDEVKQRTKATPFGFGVTWDGFDNTQLAILAALGLSKTR